MHVRAKQIAVLGLFIAFNVLLLLLSSILEFNTLFLLAAASFMVGIAVREYGFKLAFAYYAANTFINFMTAPNKYYCFTLAAMGIYLLLTELFFVLFIKIKIVKLSRLLLIIIKCFIFNAFYIPMLLLAPKLIYSGQLNTGILIALLLGGQAVLVLYDMGYQYFMSRIWVRFRKYLR